MRPRKKHLMQVIEEQAKIIKHLEKSVIESRAEIIMLRRKYEKKASNSDN